MALLFDRENTDYPCTPQIHLDALKPEDVLLSSSEYSMLRLETISIIRDILVDHLPQLAHLKEKKIRPAKVTKTEVIRLPALPNNEQHYQEVVKILQSYQTLVEDVYSDANLDLQNVHIGGDQLTRERFSGAKSLRFGNRQTDSFASLSPISFEFFHLMMNFLDKVVFRRLYNSDSHLDQGTMKCEANRIRRNDIDANVTKAYEADREFFISFYRAYVVEGFLEYMDLKDTNGVPSGVPKPGSPELLKEDWVETNIGSFVDQEVLSAWSGRARQEQTNEGNFSVT